MIARQLTEDGFTLIAERLPNSDLCCVMLWCHIGRFHESGNKVGAADILGREFITGHQAWAGALGGVASTVVADEHLYHYLLVPESRWQVAVERLAESVSGNGMTPLQFETAKRELLALQGRRLNLADDSLAQLICGRHFAAFPGCNPGDRLAAMEKLDYPAFIAFRRQVYQPTQMVYAVVGAVNPDEVFQQFNKVLSLQTLGDSVTGILRIAPIPITVHIISTQRQAVGLGFVVPPMSLLSSIPLGLFTGMLEMRPTRLLDTFFYSGREFAYWLLLSRPHDQGRSFPVGEIISEAQRLFLDDEINPHFLNRAKAIAERHFLEESEGVLGRAYTLCYFEGRQGCEPLTGYPQQLRQCSAENLHQAKQRIAHLAPEYIAAAPDYAQGRDLLRKLQHAYQEPVADVEAVLQPEEPIQLWPTSATEQAFAGSQPIRKHESDNQAFVEHAGPFPGGVKVLSLHDQGLQLDYFGLYQRGGRIFENEHNCGITQLLFSALLASFSNRLDQRQGVVRRHSLNKAVEWLGGYVEADVTADISGVRGLILPEQSAEVFDEVARSFFFPRFPEGMVLQWVKQTLLERSRLRQRDLFHRSVDLFYETIFGIHPYGLPRFGSEKSLNDLTAKDLNDWHQGWIHPTRAVLVVSTSRHVDEVREFFQNWKLPSVPIQGDAPAEILSLRLHSKFGKGVEIKNHQDRASSMVLGFPVPYQKDEDHSIAIDILQHALVGVGGLLQPESGENILQRVKSFYVPLAKGGVFFLYLEYHGNRADQVRKFVHEKLSSIVDHGLDAVALGRAKQFTIGSQRVAMQAPMHSLYEMARMHLLYGDAMRFQAYARAVHRLRGDEVHAVARLIIKLERFTSIVIRSAHEMA